MTDQVAEIKALKKEIRGLYQQVKKLTTETEQMVKQDQAFKTKLNGLIVKVSNDIAENTEERQRRERRMREKKERKKVRHKKSSRLRIDDDQDPTRSFTPMSEEKSVGSHSDSWSITINDDAEEEEDEVVPSQPAPAPPKEEV